MSARTARKTGRRTAASRAKTPRSPASSVELLLAEADHARQSAYAPYSKFPVGAALLGRSGRVYRGCNVENSSFGLSICAERNAVFQAVAEGEREFTAIAVSANPGEAPSPCGACRQVLQEFGPRMWVYWRKAQGGIVRARVESLLPRPFRFAKRKGAKRRSG